MDRGLVDAIRNLAGIALGMPRRQEETIADEKLS
jgi:hypothetical protein